LLFVPLYVKLLGAEAYGLVGFFASFQAILMMIFDMGLGATLTRELARLSADASHGKEARDTVRTIESVYLGTVTALFIAIQVLASFYAAAWFKTEHLSGSTVVRSVRLMSIAIVLQLLAWLYLGGLNGLRRQVYGNVTLVGVGVARGLGSVIVLWAVAPSIELFFVVQSAISAVQAFLMRRGVWRSIPPSAERPRFHGAILRRVWKYSVGIFGLSIASAVLFQIDKLTLSRLLPLETLSYYTLAWSFALVPYSILASPFGQACLPRLIQLSEAGKEAELARLYHRASQALSCVLAPASVVMFLYAGPLIRIWLRNAGIANKVHPLAAILVLPMTIQGLLVLPYIAQLAHAWTRLAVATNAVAVGLMVPLMIFMVRRYQGYGACVVWIMIELLYLGSVLGIMHRRVLKGEASRWLFGDVLRPFAAAWLAGYCASWALSHSIIQAPPIAVSIAVALVAMPAAVMSAPEVRREAQVRLSEARVYVRSRQRQIIEALEVGKL
jgi:O-antigen/teichoic acid export membrane protein